MDAGYKLEDLDGDSHIEFKSADSRFRYKFNCFACSGFPIQIWQYSQGKMIDVTRKFPKLVYKDAHYWWTIYQKGVQSNNPSKGILSAYMADKYLLNQIDDGWQTLEQVYRYPDRKDFFVKLQRFLKETGYAN